MAIAASALSFAGCAAGPDDRTARASRASAATSVEVLPWWRKTIVYEAYPKSFKSSKGAETGDIAGVTSRLDYLRELGFANVAWPSISYYNDPSSHNQYSAVLSDERFDFSDAYVIAVGCAGAARDYGVLGDVYVISGVVSSEICRGKLYAKRIWLVPSCNVRCQGKQNGVTLWVIPTRRWR